MEKKVRENIMHTIRPSNKKLAENRELLSQLARNVEEISMQTQRVLDDIYSAENNEQRLAACGTVYNFGHSTGQVVKNFGKLTFIGASDCIDRLVRKKVRLVIELMPYTEISSEIDEIDELVREIDLNAKITKQTVKTISKELKNFGLDAALNKRVEQGKEASLKLFNKANTEAKSSNGNTGPIKNAPFKRYSSTIITSLLRLLSRDLFQTSVDKYETDKYVKNFFSWDHLITMVVAQLLGADSLRDIVGQISCMPQRKKQLLIDNPPARSTLATANKTRDWHLFKDTFDNLLASLKAHFKKSRHIAESCKLPVYSIDSTVISLSLKLFNWAQYRTRKGGIKLHTLIENSDNGGGIPILFNLTYGKSHDSTQAVDLIKGLEPQSIVAMDRGYVDAALFRYMSKNRLYFVTRTKENISFEILKTRELADKDQKELINSPVRGGSKHIITQFRLLEDNIVKYASPETRKVYPLVLRLIKLKDDASGEYYEFLTNNMRQSAATISNIYKQRWQIESFFKLIKQHFHIKAFFGTSTNAVEIQVWTVLISILLIYFIRDISMVKWNFSNLLRVIRTAFFEYDNLYVWINIPHSERPPPLEQETPAVSKGSLF
jgi:hypothetical protein